MARNYDVWFMENSARAYLDSGTQMVHDGRGHSLYRYQGGKLLALSGKECLTVKADGRILDKTGSQAGFITDYGRFTEEIRNTAAGTARPPAGAEKNSPQESQTGSAGAGKPQAGVQKKKTRGWVWLLVILGFIFLVSRNNSGSNPADSKGSRNSAGSNKRSAVSVVNTAARRPNLTSQAPTSAARIERDWQSLMRLPSADEIDLCNRTARMQSPYLTAWMATGKGGPFTGYSVDFRAEYQPNATYCCLGNFDLDYSALKKKYKEYHTEYRGVAGYAGLQRLDNGDLKSILSFWDVYCTDRSGRTETIRASLVYPASDGNDSFGGEGTGAHHLTDYAWQPGKWYRMRLTCGKSETTGNTTIEQWVQDLSDMAWTKLCVYDLGVPNVAFKGDTAVFLENFYPEYAGEIRTMECRNFSVFRNKWQGIRKGTLTKRVGAYKGSCGYGVSGDTICMITTGVEGKGGRWDDLPFTLK